ITQYLAQRGDHTYSVMRDIAWRTRPGPAAASVLLPPAGRRRPGQHEFCDLEKNTRWQSKFHAVHAPWHPGRRARSSADTADCHAATRPRVPTLPAPDILPVYVRAATKSSAPTGCERR